MPAPSALRASVDRLLLRRVAAGLARQADQHIGRRAPKPCSDASPRCERIELRRIVGEIGGAVVVRTSIKVPPTKSMP